MYVKGGHNLIAGGGGGRKVDSYVDYLNEFIYLFILFINFFFNAALFVGVCCSSYCAARSDFFSVLFTFFSKKLQL